jgi:hypothetical protein
MFIWGNLPQKGDTRSFKTHNWPGRQPNFYLDPVDLGIAIGAAGAMEA